MHAFRPGADEDDSPWDGKDVKGVPILMSRGDVLFIKSRTMHASRENTSSHIRFSVDLRYHITGTPSGRSSFPAFVARSRKDPSTVMNSHTTFA